MLLPLVLSTLVPAANLVPFEIDSKEDYARAVSGHYTKHEFQVPMRDGITLHTVAWIPKDETKKWPILVMRTPYGVTGYGMENAPNFAGRHARKFAPAKAMVQRGYIFVQQDVRGKMMSQGEFVDVRPAGKIDESTDAYDTVAWLVRHLPNNNRRVGFWGISYPGFYAAQAAIDAHPAVKAVSPQAPVTEWFIGDDFHHGGAVCVADAVGFFANFGRKRDKPSPRMRWDFHFDVADVYDRFLRLGPLANVNRDILKGEIKIWNDLIAHPDRDAWWQARDPRPRYRSIKPAVMVVGGWYDAEDLWGALETYRSMDRQTRSRNRVSLVMGPWGHGDWHRKDGSSHGDIRFGRKTSHDFVKRYEVPFFAHHLHGDKSAKVPPEAVVFFTGENTWREYPKWPPARSKPIRFYMGASGGLVERAPTAAEGADRYPSNPRKPVPYFGKPSGRIDRRFMTGDQRFAHRRPDVLHYETEVLEQDVTLAGPLEAKIGFDTTGTDADLVVKIIDIWPEDTKRPSSRKDREPAFMGGYQQLVRAEALRTRYRDGFDEPKAWTPRKPEMVTVQLPDVAHTFRKGHRIAVQIQSSWFPFIDANPQTFVNVFEAKESDFVEAEHRVHRSKALPSRIEAMGWRGL